MRHDAMDHYLPTWYECLEYFAQKHPASIDPFALQPIGQQDEIVPTGKIVMEIIARARCHTPLHTVIGNDFLGK